LQINELAGIMINLFIFFHATLFLFLFLFAHENTRNKKEINTGKKTPHFSLNVCF